MISEEAVRELTFKQVVNRINNDHNEQYYPNSYFDAWDHLLVLDRVANSTTDNESYDKETNDSVNVNGMINDTCKHYVNFELTQSKQEVITKLKQCNYRTQRIEIAALLEELFKEWNTKQGHWLYIAQHWSPRSINYTINGMVKGHNSGRITFKNPAAYFTYVIKYRKKRRS